MPQTLAFDVYGTLIDTSGVFHALREIVGPEAAAFMDLWRNKQLEYSFRRGLMGSYADFSVCTRDALEYCCQFYGNPMKNQQKERVMAAYTTLPVFKDVIPALEVLEDDGHSIFAFSNGSTQAVSQLLEYNGIAHYFKGVVSAKTIQTFKPNPLVYEHFNASTKTSKNNSWLISGNSFDVIGALAYGMQGVWVKRSEDAVFDPWEIPSPTVVSTLTELPALLSAAS